MIIYCISLMIILMIILMIMSILILLISNKQSVQLYNQALNKARKENRKLLVLGNPYNFSGKVITLFTKTYGCGDLCIDMNGCGKCKNVISDKLENVLHKLNSNEYVVFESGLLEVVDYDQLDKIVYHIYRISGSKDNIFARHFIHNHKILYKYLIKYIYLILGEGNINRFVVKYPPDYKYEFEKI